MSEEIDEMSGEDELPLHEEEVTDETGSNDESETDENQDRPVAVTPTPPGNTSIGGGPRPITVFLGWLNTTRYTPSQRSGILGDYNTVLSMLEESLLQIAEIYTETNIPLFYSTSTGMIASIDTHAQDIALNPNRVSGAIHNAVMNNNFGGIEDIKSDLFHEVGHFLYDPCMQVNGELKSVFNRSFTLAEHRRRNLIFDSVVEKHISDDFEFAKAMIQSGMQSEWGYRSPGSMIAEDYLHIGHRMFVSDALKNSARNAFVRVVGDEGASDWDGWNEQLMKLRDVFPDGEEREECVKLVRPMLEFLATYFPEARASRLPSDMPDIDSETVGTSGRDIPETDGEGGAGGSSGEDIAGDDNIYGSPSGGDASSDGEGGRNQDNIIYEDAVSEEPESDLGDVDYLPYEAEFEDELDELEEPADATVASVDLSQSQSAGTDRAALPGEIDSELVEAVEEAAAVFTEQDKDEPEEPEELLQSHDIEEDAPLNLVPIEPSYQAAQQIEYDMVTPGLNATRDSRFTEAHDSVKMLMEANREDVPDAMVGDLDLDSFIESATFGYSKPNVFRYTNIAESSHGDLYVVIGYDCSGSMKGTEHHDVVWRAKRLFDKLGVKCCVIAWSDSAGILYSAEEAAEESRFRLPANIGGHTVPEQGSQIAYEIFKRERAQVYKLWLNMTDGEWRTGDLYSLRMSQELDVLTSLTFLRPQMSHADVNRWANDKFRSEGAMWQGYEVRHTAVSMSEVADHIVDIVTGLVESTALQEAI